jgi:CHAD domain-containing protein
LLEIEDKFRVHQDFVLPELNGNDGVVAGVSPARTYSLVATYHDTEDLRLARSGITLRHRTGEGTPSWQLKLPADRPGARHELDVPGDETEIPGALRLVVLARVRRAELAPRATLTTDRTTYDLLGADRQVVAELVDDHVDAHDGGQRVARFREIEVEDRGGGTDVLDRVGSRLRAAGAVQGEFEPKVVRALGQRASAPPDPPLPPRVRRRDPARTLVAAVLREHVHRLLDNDVVVRAGLDDDGIHQMRVAGRRLRSALRDFGPLLDPTWAAQLDTELRWLGQQLSPARDLQVVTDRLMSALDRLPAERSNGSHSRSDELDRPAASTQINRVLEPEIEAARASVESALASDRYLDLLDALVDAATHPRTTDEADRSCRTAMPPLVHASRKRLARRFSAAIDSGTPESHHRARKAAKSTRYLADALAPVYGKQARRFATAVKGIQELLGEHQDAMVAAETLHRIAAGPRATQATFTLGVLYAQQLELAKALRAQFAEVAPTVVRPRSQRWVDD